MKTESALRVLAARFFVGGEGEKRNKKRWIFGIAGFVFAVLLLTGFSPLLLANYAHFVVSRSSNVTLYSLDPSTLYTFVTDDPEVDRLAAKSPGYAEKFHKAGVMGKMKVTNAQQRKDLSDALQRGMSEGGSWGIMCFDPRHGIRARWGVFSVDLVICFACQKMDVYTSLGSARVNPSSSPKDAFNAILDRARIPRSKPPNEE